MTAAVIERYPDTFARVDIVKAAAVANGVDAGEVKDGDDRLWILGGPLTITVTEHGDPVRTVTVPTGFVTDGASVPYLAQLLTGWHPWDEPQRWAAIAHDWLYCCNGRPVAGHPYLGDLPTCAKRYADRVFRAVLTAAGAHPIRAETMYRAVHLFGGHAYRSDQATGPTIRTT